jgi:hypothetical protein
MQTVRLCSAVISLPGETLIDNSRGRPSKPNRRLGGIATRTPLIELNHQDVGDGNASLFLKLGKPATHRRFQTARSLQQESLR